LLSACENTTASTVKQSSVDKKPDPRVANQIVEKDLWRYIANRYTLDGYDNKQLDGHIRWFKKNPDYLTRVSKRAGDYLYLVTKEVEKAGLPIEIALLPIVESAYYPFSFSHGTASGLWQFIPSTGKLYGLGENWWYDDRRDVLKSTKAAIKYLRNLSKLFNNDYLLAIAAYNSGPGRVQKAIAKNKRLGKKTDFWHLDLPLETRGYVPRLLAVAKIIKNPQQYSQSITPVANEEKLKVVKLQSQLDLALISEWTGLTLDEIYNLNPGIKRWATPDSKAYKILLPKSVVDEFNKKLTNSDKNSRIKWIRHKVGSGQSLSGIAHKYKTTIEQIKNVNDLDDNSIRAGDFLIVPIARFTDNFYSMSETEREKKRINSKKSGYKSIHKVKSGESLWSIARKYGVSVENIIKWNHLSDIKALQIGKELVIWQKSSIDNSSLKNIVNTGLDINRKVSYTVKSGDNLSTIAEKFDTTVSKIAKLNKLDKNKSLKIGQKLKIVVNVINSKMK